MFGNIHATRLRRCSMELLRRCGPGRLLRDDDVLRSSLAWFRGHDLAHFWRLTREPRRTGDAGSGPGKALTAFERMTLEETYADLLGLLSVASLGQLAELSQAYAAELLRYLSRECSFFADSAAAALTIGWLRANGVTPILGTAAWLEAALAPLGRLGQVIHRVLWEGQDHELGALRAALRAGHEFGGACRACTYRCRQISNTYSDDARAASAGRHLRSVVRNRPCHRASFRRRGDHVVNLDRSAPAPGDAVGQWVAADVRDWAALDDAIGRVIAEHGPSRWRSRTPGSARVARWWT